jgi:class 3 adenylate cyclase
MNVALSSAAFSTFNLTLFFYLLSAATILYASIAGFAEWSSTRDPREAFTLLESLFLAFDKLADEHQGVYKVETVLDSYIAASGVPKPRDDHAVCMARFATACRDKSAAILHDLGFSNSFDNSFWEDDTTGVKSDNASAASSASSSRPLCLRFGLHSGAVTGGVLRGHRSRFQLFGDAAYTAAKIER